MTQHFRRDGPARLLCVGVEKVPPVRCVVLGGDPPARQVTVDNGLPSLAGGSRGGHANGLRGHSCGVSSRPRHGCIGKRRRVRSRTEVDNFGAPTLLASGAACFVVRLNVGVPSGRRLPLGLSSYFVRPVLLAGCCVQHSAPVALRADGPALGAAGTAPGLCFGGGRLGLRCGCRCRWEARRSGGRGSCFGRRTDSFRCCRRDG